MILFLICILSNFSCNKNCEEKYKLENESLYFLNELLVDDSFCDIADMASAGDEEAIIKLVNIPSRDGLCNIHGKALRVIIANCSEKRFIEVIEKNKSRIDFYFIDAILFSSFENDISDGTEYHKALPLVYVYIDKNTVHKN